MTAVQELAYINVDGIIKNKGPLAFNNAYLSGESLQN